MSGYGRSGECIDAGAGAAKGRRSIDCKIHPAPARCGVSRRYIRREIDCITERRGVAHCLEIDVAGSDADRATYRNGRVVHLHEAATARRGYIHVNNARACAAKESRPCRRTAVVSRRVLSDGVEGESATAERTCRGGTGTSAEQYLAGDGRAGIGRLRAGVDLNGCRTTVVQAGIERRGEVAA